MRFLVVGDLHISTYPKLGKNSEGVNNRIQDFIDFFEWLVEIEERECISHTIFTGDIFDSRISITPVESDVFTNYIDNSKCKEIIICAGNHDQNGDYSFLKTYDTLSSKVSYKSEPSAMPREGIGFLPFSKDVDFIKEKIKKLSALDLKYIIGHVGLGDVELQKGFCLKDQAFSDEFNNPDTKVLLGHYHNRKEVNDNITYVGTPLSKTFSEAENSDNHFITMVDTIRGEEELLITVPFRQHQDVHVRSVKDIAKLNTDNYLRVFTYNNTPIPKRPNIIEIISIGQSTEKQSKEVAKIANLSDEGLLKDFIENSSFIHKDKVLQEALRILKDD